MCSYWKTLRVAFGVVKGYETLLMIMRRRAELLGLDAQERRKQRELDGNSEGLDELLARVLEDEAVSKMLWTTVSSADVYETLGRPWQEAPDPAPSPRGEGEID